MNLTILLLHPLARKDYVNKAKVSQSLFRVKSLISVGSTVFSADILRVPRGIFFQILFLFASRKSDVKQ